MNLSQIKKKYKDILQSSSSSSSSDNFEQSNESNPFPSVFNSFTQKHQRTQSVTNKQNHSLSKNPNPKPNISLHTQIIHLKERLGQANQKLQNKNNQLKSEHDKKSQIFEEKKLLEKHLVTFQEQIEKRDKQLIELKANKIGYQNKLKELEEKYQDKDLDKELLKKQVSFYEIEQKKYKEILKDKEDEIKSLVNKNKGMKLLEHQNQRLKNDIKRLVALLEDKKIFKPTKHFNRSYIGKNVSQDDCWYNRDTIASAQNFLTKHKIDEKPVLKGLVKLIQNIKNTTTNNIKRSTDCRSKSINKSQNRSKSRRRKDSSVTYKDISVILPNHTTSSKNCVTSSMYQSLFHSKSKIKSICKETIEEEQKIFSCRQIIREYVTGMDQLLDKKVCSKGKIRKLTEWLLASVDNIIKEQFVTFQ